MRYTSGEFVGVWRLHQKSMTMGKSRADIVMVTDLGLFGLEIIFQ